MLGAAGSATEFIPFFRLHESRNTMYSQHSTPANFERLRADNAAREAKRLALAPPVPSTRWHRASSSRSRTISSRGEGIEVGVNGGCHWRHAKKWFSYELKNPKREAKLLPLTFAKAHAARRFDIETIGVLLAEVTLAKDAARSSIPSTTRCRPSSCTRSRTRCWCA